MSNKAILESLKGIRKNLRELNEDSKIKMCNSTQIRRHATIFIRESYMSMMGVTLKSLKDNEMGHASVLLTLQNYMLTAYFQTIIETENFSDFYELLNKNIKELEQKIKELESNPKILKVS